MNQQPEAQKLASSMSIILLELAGNVLFLLHYFSNMTLHLTDKVPVLRKRMEAQMLWVELCNSYTAGPMVQKGGQER